MSFTHCGEFRPSLKDLVLPPQDPLQLAATPLRVTKKKEQKLCMLYDMQGLTGVWTTLETLCKGSFSSQALRLVSHDT